MNASNNSSPRSGRTLGPPGKRCHLPATRLRRQQPTPVRPNPTRPRRRPHDRLLLDISFGRARRKNPSQGQQPPPPSLLEEEPAGDQCLCKVLPGPGPTAARPFCTTLAPFFAATMAGVLAEQGLSDGPGPCVRSIAIAVDLQPWGLVRLRQCTAGLAGHHDHRRDHGRSRGLRLAGSSGSGRHEQAGTGSHPRRGAGQPSGPGH